MFSSIRFTPCAIRDAAAKSHNLNHGHLRKKVYHGMIQFDGQHSSKQLRVKSQSRMVRRDGHSLNIANFLRLETR